MLALAFFVHRPASAQEADSGLGRRQIAASCERAKHGKALAATRAEKVANIVALQDCGDDGVRLLSDYWRTAGDDSEVLAALAGVSARINDRRLYQAARSVLLDQGRSESTRLSALEVLVAGFDPSLAVAFPAPIKPMQSTYVALGHTSHRSSGQAPQPVGRHARKDLLVVLDGLASSDPSERIRKVAQELGPLLKRRDA
jgi:hypothetical protein